MIKQIKNTIILTILMLFFTTPIYANDNEIIETDVVENKSVIEEQVYETEEKQEEDLFLPSYIDFDIPEHNDFKSYMGYRAITNTSSDQYDIQNNYAETDIFGFRKVNGRYCVALGSHFGLEIGQYFDLILENGLVLPCILGDIKADKDTDNLNIFTQNGCCSEFIVDTSTLIQTIKYSGNVSSLIEEWQSSVDYVRVYENNILVE